MSGGDRSGHGVCLAAWAALTLVSVDLITYAPAAAPLSPGFEPPAPGTYRLERIMGAPDGVVLDVAGRSQQLSRWTRGRVTLLSFVYTSCNDPHPVVLNDIQTLVLEDVGAVAHAKR